MSFVSRLPAGHEILSMGSADLLRLLNDDGRVAGEGHSCRQKRHWKGECPVFWGDKGTALPGWKLDGKKDKKAWEGDNPKKETISCGC